MHSSGLKVSQMAKGYCKEERRTLHCPHKFYLFFPPLPLKYIHISIGVDLWHISEQGISVHCTCGKDILFSKFVELISMKRIQGVVNLYFDWPPDNLPVSDGNVPSLGYVPDFAMNILMISVISSLHGLTL